MPLHSNITDIQFNGYLLSGSFNSTSVCYETGTKRKKVSQAHHRPDVPRGFQEVTVPRLRDNGPG